MTLDEHIAQWQDAPGCSEEEAKRNMHDFFAFWMSLDEVALDIDIDFFCQPDRQDSQKEPETVPESNIEKAEKPQ